jgi:hypothetical protein
MIPKARRLHRRWMLTVGLCLLLLLIPLGLIGACNSSYNQNYMVAGVARPAPIPGPLLLGVLVLLGVPGVGLIIGKFVLTLRYDPNAQDVETRKRLGQARAILHPQSRWQVFPDPSQERKA